MFDFIEKTKLAAFDDELEKNAILGTLAGIGALGAGAAGAAGLLGAGAAGLLGGVGYLGHKAIQKGEDWIEKKRHSSDLIGKLVSYMKGDRSRLDMPTNEDLLNNPEMRKRMTADGIKELEHGQIFNNFQEAIRKSPETRYALSTLKNPIFETVLAGDEKAFMRAMKEHRTNKDLMDQITNLKKYVVDTGGKVSQKGIASITDPRKYMEYGVNKGIGGAGNVKVKDVMHGIGAIPTAGKAALGIGGLLAAKGLSDFLSGGGKKKEHETVVNHY